AVEAGPAVVHEEGDAFHSEPPLLPVEPPGPIGVEPVQPRGPGVLLPAVGQRGPPRVALGCHGRAVVRWPLRQVVDGEGRRGSRGRTLGGARPRPPVARGRGWARPLERRAGRPSGHTHIKYLAFAHRKSPDLHIGIRDRVTRRLGPLRHARGGGGGRTRPGGPRPRGGPRSPTGSRRAAGPPSGSGPRSRSGSPWAPGAKSGPEPPSGSGPRGGPGSGRGAGAR